ncbi:cis-zeatin O-glucosyltransferase 1-like [Hordeum vulgare subsp. vulgare]|uniref:Glycosyltransferase n=1 Tax=Hordeum vulgare subsp. vulgare TaxID=112509 RepID=E5F4M6_HORVV|nr:cis-zeatin O-glucosyltransferase 1-like [Hordeum vulgare subsp. vulgare]ADG56506.1 putative cis-zeatin O-glucosyltransferase [Hordeum vulgare subsp. vulgare]
MAVDSMESVAFVAVPFPAQGHLNQLMHLSLLAASRGLSVHYAAPAAHLRQARSRLHGWDAQALGSVQFHDLGVSAYESPAPDPTAPCPFPNHLLSMWQIFTTAARAPLAALLESLSATHRRVVVVHDRLNSFAAVEAARLSNGESFALQCVAISYNVGWLDIEHPLLRDNGLEFLPIDACMSKEFLEFVFQTEKEMQEQGGVPSAGMVMNTCRALEGEFMDAIEAHPVFKDQKLFAVGPLNPLLDATARTPAKTRHECMDWLDMQPPASVLYVSFGTTTSLRGEQIAELAAALKGSRQRFIWVLREADRADIFTEPGESRHDKLLSEFTKETEGTGLVITGWAPQLEILAHGATAAFMSHCGWNSTMESLSHGKPILAWPMHSDQPWDAELLCKYLKVGLLVRPWEKHSEVVPSEAIQEVIEEAMLTDKGMAVRQRAKVLGEAVRAAVADGGSSSKGLDDFVAYVTR